MSAAYPAYKVRIKNERTTIVFAGTDILRDHLRDATLNRIVHTRLRPRVDHVIQSADNGIHRPHHHRQTERQTQNLQHHRRVVLRSVTRLRGHRGAGVTRLRITMAAKPPSFPQSCERESSHTCAAGQPYSRSLALRGNACACAPARATRVGLMSDYAVAALSLI